MANKGKYYESQFEEATIELLREAHWQYTLGDDIHRKYTDPLIEENLRNFLAVQYKDKNLTTSEMDGIVANLRNTGGQNDYYALRNAFLLYRDGYDFAYSDSRDNPFRMEYIDFEHPDHNIFRVGIPPGNAALIRAEFNAFPAWGLVQNRAALQTEAAIQVDSAVVRSFPAGQPCPSTERYNGILLESHCLCDCGISIPLLAKSHNLVLLYISHDEYPPV
mgnify:CR=1 FL=1